MRLTDYVYGNRQNLRDWLSERVVEVFLGDSFYGFESQDSLQPGVRVRMMPKRFCGGFNDAGIYDPWVDFAFGVTGVRGGFTASAGNFPNNTYPWRVFEAKFNGNAPGANHYVYYGHGGTMPFTAARTAAGGTSWGDKWDWLRGRKGILHTYLIGSGNDHPACRAVMRGDPSGTVYAESDDLPTASLGQLIHVQTPFDCTTLTTEDVLTGLWIPSPYTAPANGTYRIFLGQTVEVGEDDAEPDPTPGYAYYNLGAFGTRLSDWQDPAKVNQASFWDFIAATGCTDLAIDFAVNEAYLASISSVAQFRAQLEALRTAARRARPGIRIRYETPHCNNTANDTIVEYCRDAGLQMAAAYDDFNVLDLHQYVKDEWGNNRLLAYAVNPGVDNDHLTEPGRVLTTRLRMQMLMAAAATITDVNVISVGGVTANPTSEGTKFDGVTAGGSTFTRVMLAEAYDVAKELEYVGANLIVDDFIEVDGHALPRVIVGYGDPGSGASYVDIDPDVPYEVELSAGLATRIVAGTVTTGGGGGGGGGTGSGDTAITENGGPPGTLVDGVAAATDCMQWTINGSGADDVEVVAYLKSDYDAALTGTDNRQGTTFTGTDGRWVEPLMLDAGTYKIVGNKDGFVMDAFDLVVP